MPRGKPRNKRDYEVVATYYEAKGAQYCASICGKTDSRMHQIARALGLKRCRGKKAEQYNQGVWVPTESVSSFWKRWDAGMRPTTNTDAR